MNKKTGSIIFVILLFLLIPIPTGVYKDGGTRTYTALTYKIVDWNHFYGEDAKVYKEVKLYPFPMNFMSLDRLFAREERKLVSSENSNHKTNTEEISTVHKQIELPFKAQYIRTNGYHENVEYPVVTVLHSVEELQNYYEANKNSYYLERRTEIASDSTLGFLDACDKYDASYFEEQVLILVLLEEGSGSIRHRVEKVTMAEPENEMEIAITTITPECGTDDMAEWHIFIEPEAGVTVEEDDITIFLDGKNATDKPTIASYRKNHANMSLQLPKEWQYEIYDEEAGFGISFWYGTEKENQLRLEYFDNGFAVCGTGLEEKEITLNGYRVCQGTYDNRKVWSFLSFQDTAGDYAVINETDEDWWEKHGKEVMHILATVTVGENIIGEEDVIAIAKKLATVEYHRVRANFDYQQGIWEVVFSKNSMVGGDQMIILNANGEVVDMIYGE